jgi:hypothetical protein
MIVLILSILLGYGLVGTGVFIGLIAASDDYDFTRPVRNQVIGWVIVTTIWLPLILIIAWTYRVDTYTLKEGDKNEKRNS